MEVRSKTVSLLPLVVGWRPNDMLGGSIFQKLFHRIFINQSQMDGKWASCSEYSCRSLVEPRRGCLRSWRPVVHHEPQILVIHVDHGYVKDAGGPFFLDSPNTHWDNKR